MLFTLAAFAVTLGILVVIHELGHYWVARACGVKVLRFSVGFGKVLWRRTDRRGTEWALSAIPLGGYVKMLGEQDHDDGDMPPALRAQAFSAKPVGARIAIVAAGPLFNLALAALLYAALNMIGVREPAAVLAEPAAGTRAAVAGVAAGDRVLAVDGAQVSAWGDARWLLLKQMTDKGVAEVRVATAGGGEAVRRVDFGGVSLGNMEGDVLGREGFSLVAPRPVVRGVVDGSAAAEAGLRAGDRVVAAGGVEAPSASALIAIIQRHGGQPLALEVVRDGVRLAVAVTPRTERADDGREVGRIGAQIGGDGEVVTVRHGLGTSLLKGVERTAEVSWFSLRMLGKMLVGDVALSNLSGPVTIADYAGQTARMGLESYIAFLALVSVSLGVLNLLPIPMLDGGHLLYYLVEIVRGSPPPERWLEIGQRAGVGVLMLLMAVALFNDFSRLLT